MRIKQLQSLLIIITAALFFTACEKDESTSLWNIAGNVSMKDAELESITSPMEGVKVYLFSFPFTMDTTTSWFSKESILDSALTDNNGLYNFNLVAPGDYFVFPSDTTKSYDFNWLESSDSILIDRKNTKSDYEINFTALQKIPDNGLIDLFHFRFWTKDLHTDNDYYDWKTVAVYRRTRTWEAYWDWGPRVRWGDWYFSLVALTRELRPTAYENTVNNYYLVTPQDASNVFYQYENVFKIKFYLHEFSDDTLDRFTDNVLDVSYKDFRDFLYSTDDLYVDIDVLWTRDDSDWDTVEYSIREY